MITVSLCMIVKNEADVLERCISSVQGIVDEINIVDTGSTDGTREIAAGLTPRVFDFRWVNDFSAARNFSFSKATMDYILILDADDVLLEEDRRKFMKLKEELDPSVDAVNMLYDVGFDARGNVTLSYYRERMSKRSRGFLWVEPVHEYLNCSGKIINADIHITHKKLHPSPTGRNLAIYEAMVGEGRELSPRAQYYYGRELYYNGRHEQAAAQLTKFLDGGRGWVEDCINCCCLLARAYAARKDRPNRLRALLRSFEYDIPRAEPCCEIGYWYKEAGDYRRAKHWFETALRLEKPNTAVGFVYQDYLGYIPSIELCVCHDKLGNLEEAIRCNRIAGQYKPGDPAVAYNEKYFAGLSEKAGSVNA